MATLPPANLILRALNGIRADLQGLRKTTDDRLMSIENRLDATNERLDATNQRLDATNQALGRLERRTTDGFLKTNTKLAELARVVEQHDRRFDHMLRFGIGAEVRGLRGRVDKLEGRVYGRRGRRARTRRRW